MVVLTAVAAVQQLLQWLKKDEEVTKEESRQEDATRPSPEMIFYFTRTEASFTDLYSRYKRTLERVLNIEKNMNEKHMKELDTVREEERRRYKKLLDKEKTKRQELGIGLHYWKAMAALAQDEKEKMVDEFVKEVTHWRVACSRYEELYQKSRDPSKEEKESSAECKVCLMGDVQRTFGCGHAVCAHCAKLLDLCHICRTPVERINMLFL